MEDKCPFCGSKANYAKNYTCGTFWQECSSLLIRKRDCYESQLQAQAARLAEAEGLLKRLEKEWGSGGSKSAYRAIDLLPGKFVKQVQAFLSQDPALMRGENMTNWPEKAGQPYRPANGTDGMIFMECWCEKCCHDTEEKPCDIIGLSMAFDIGHPMYPKEWVYDAEGLPCCTKFEQEPKDEVS